MHLTRTKTKKLDEEKRLTCNSCALSKLIGISVGAYDDYFRNSHRLPPIEIHFSYMSAEGSTLLLSGICLECVEFSDCTEDPLDAIEFIDPEERGDRTDLFD